MSAWDKPMVVAADGSVEFPGHDYSNKGPMFIVERLFLKQFKDGDGRNDIIVVRHPGGTCWAGNYQPREYVSVRFLVFEIIKRTAKGRWIVREITTIVPTKKTVATNIADLLE